MEFIVYVIGVALFVVPLWRILEREGINPVWSLVCAIPFGVLGLLWYLAFGRGGGRGA